MDSENYGCSRLTIFKIDAENRFVYSARQLHLKRCSWMLLLGIFIYTAFIPSGYCDRRSSNGEKYPQSPSSSAIVQNSARKWSNWTSSSSSSSSTSKFPISDVPSAWHENPVNVVPLTLEEYERRRKSRIARIPNANKLPSTTTSSTPSLKDLDDNDVRVEVDDGDSKDNKDKVSGQDAPVDMEFIRAQALRFGKYMLENLSQPTNSDLSRKGKSILLDSNLNREDAVAGQNPAERQRGVVDWLARLIGVQGKTLGEFLREYQVHVLYDLVFTFFKWIFFLYAGLLIP